MRMEFRKVVFYAFALALACGAAGHSQVADRHTPTQAAQNTVADARYPCRAVHTLDFWVGSFDATPWNQPDAAPSGHLHNTREYEGCVIVERWASAKGSSGMSMAFSTIRIATCGA